MRGRGGHVGDTRHVAMGDVRHVSSHVASGRHVGMILVARGHYTLKW